MQTKSVYHKFSTDIGIPILYTDISKLEKDIRAHRLNPVRTIGRKPIYETELYGTKVSLVYSPNIGRIIAVTKDNSIRGLEQTILSYKKSESFITDYLMGV